MTLEVYIVEPSLEWRLDEGTIEHREGLSLVSDI